jgi:hypothetical protein
MFTEAGGIEPSVTVSRGNFIDIVRALIENVPERYIIRGGRYGGIYEDAADRIYEFQLCSYPCLWKLLEGTMAIASVARAMEVYFIDLKEAFESCATGMFSAWKHHYENVLIHLAPRRRGEKIAKAGGNA